ncbi:hypothetical protein ElyMa_000106400 [Elysia marginata]|uniref:Uncharacterized protein n=1 Tax=Elysia marginata TaxID=1093978 RepID=A0AAV4EL99_9GAST|nr:hypothetical protein ElyMa_000106400 [Elysia marginata]
MICLRRQSLKLPLRIKTSTVTSKLAMLPFGEPKSANDGKPALWPSGKTTAQRSGSAGSIPGRVKPRTLKLVLAADPPSVWQYGFSAKFDRPGVKIM